MNSFLESFVYILVLLAPVWFAFIAYAINSSCHFPYHQYPDLDSRIPVLPTLDGILKAFYDKYNGNMEDVQAREELTSLLRRWHTLDSDAAHYRHVWFDCSGGRSDSDEKRMHWLLSDLPLYAVFCYFIYTGMPNKNLSVLLFIVSCVVIAFIYHKFTLKTFEKPKEEPRQKCTDMSFDGISDYLYEFLPDFSCSSMARRLADGINGTRKSMTIAKYIRLAIIAGSLWEIFNAIRR